MNSDSHFEVGWRASRGSWKAIFTPRTVRGTQLLLVAVALVPFLVLLATIYGRWYDTRKEAEYQANVELARSVSITFQALVEDILHQESAIGQLFTSSHSPAEQEAASLLRSQASEFKAVRNFDWMTPEGKVVASSDPTTVGMDAGDRDYIAAIRDGKSWAISNLIQQGRAGGVPVFVIVRGIRDDAGTLRGIAGATVSLEQLGEALPIGRADAGAIAIIDSNGRLVYRYPEAHFSWEQRDILRSQSSVREALAGKEVTDTFVSVIDGKTRMTALVPIAGIGWAASANRPVEEALAPVVGDLTRDAVLMIAVALGALLAAGTVSRRLTDPLYRLRSYAMAVGRGETLPRVNANGPAEIEDLADAFDFMVSKLHVRELQRSQLVQELRESEERFRATFNGAGIGMSIMDDSDRAVVTNAAFQNMLGYSADELSHMPYTQYSHPDDNPRNAELRRQMMEGKIDRFQMEKRYIRKDGRLVWGRLTVSAVRDPNGEMRFSIGMIEDITGQKQLEEQLLRAQRLEAAGRIAGQVAHDFNNLLSPMVAYPELIKMCLPKGHPAAQYCDSMMEAAETMAAINEDMLALGRRGHFTQQCVDLNQLVRQAVSQMTSRPATLTVQMELAPDLLPISGAPAQLLRVVSNLMVNSLEAMQDVGLLVIQTENVYVDSPIGKYGRVEAGEYALLTVSDTGCGIPFQIQDRIFDAFFTTKSANKRRGSGLGLSIVQSVVEDHHGYLDFESEVGVGTTFRIYLPIARDCVVSPVKQESAHGTERILIVDDDQFQREVAVEQLRTLGYSVEAVSSGERAIAYLQERPVDLLLLDMIMPPGLDGTETYRRVLDLRPGQKAIVVSGFSESDRVAEALSLGASGYLRKPLTLEKLATAVRQALDRAAFPKPESSL